MIDTKDSPLPIGLHRLFLAALLLLTALLRFCLLAQNGWGNIYYAAAVRSMRGSFPNFLFAAYDPAGFLTVDKPPLALAVQTISSLILGYHGLALLLPEAVAGCLSVFVLYRLVARASGAIPGLLAGLFLALTPMMVAVDRMNLPDSLLTLTLLLSADALLQWLDRGKTRYLLASALLLGLGFEIKMWEAWVLLPFFTFLYLRYTPLPLRSRMILLCLAGIIVVAVSFSYVLFVDTIPPDQRPYVGGSRNNSALDLIFHYNGLDRLQGGKDQLGGAIMEPQGALAGLASMPGFYAGPPGPFRLLRHAVGPQLFWLLGLCPVGLFAWRQKRAVADTPERALLALALGWSLSYGIVFSLAQGTVHPYYVSVLAPGIAALAALCWHTLWQNESGSPLLRGLAGMAGAGFQIYLLMESREAPQLLFLGPLLALGLSTLALAPMLSRRASLAALIGLLLCPGYWCYTAVAVPGNGLTPSTGPEMMAGGWRNPPPQMPPAFTTRLLAFLTTVYRGERFLLASGGVYNASPIIVQTGRPVMAIGGFLGSDPILTPAQFANRVQKGEVRFLLLTPNDGLAGNTYLPPFADWASDACRPVAPTLWMAYQSGYGMEQMTLYDCAPERGGYREQAIPR